MHYHIEIHYYYLRPSSQGIINIQINFFFFWQDIQINILLEHITFTTHMIGFINTSCGLCMSVKCHWFLLYMDYIYGGHNHNFTLPSLFRKEILHFLNLHLKLSLQKVAYKFLRHPTKNQLMSGIMIEHFKRDAIDAWITRRMSIFLKWINNFLICLII